MGPGSGKTLFALQFLVHGAQSCAEPGIFVAFDGAFQSHRQQCQSFGWPLAALQRRRLYFMDAQPQPDLVQSGDFDLSGMLAGLQAKADAIKARRIVLDALDIVLDLLPTRRRAGARSTACMPGCWLRPERPGHREIRRQRRP